MYRAGVPFKKKYAVVLSASQGVREYRFFPRREADLKHDELCR